MRAANGLLPAGLCCLLCLVHVCWILQTAKAQTNEGAAPSWQQRVRLLDRKLARTNRKLRRLEQLATDIAGYNELHSRFSDDPACPDGTDRFFFSQKTGSCYHLEPTSVMTNWTEAKSVCQRLSSKAHLVSIESVEEQTLLASKWRQEIGIATFGRFWTSGRKYGNVWKWAISGRVFEYTNWMPLVPQDNDNFRCAAVYSGEAYTWSGVACWAPHLVTCEINI